MSEEIDTSLSAADIRLRMINSVAASPVANPDNPDMTAELSARENTDDELKDQFGKLLQTAAHADPKHKFLWHRVFRNAMDDRRVASILLMDLYMSTIQSPDKHVMHGDLLSKYMERMEKANAQIIKLSEMVQKSIDMAPRPPDDEEKSLLGLDIYDVLEKNAGKPQTSSSGTKSASSKSNSR